MSKNSVAGFQSISHAKKLPQYKKNDDFILSRSLSFPDYSWWCEKLQLQGVYSNNNPSGWWAGRMQCQSSFSQISLQWVCGRQRCSVGMTSAGRIVASAQVWPFLPGTAAGGDTEFNRKRETHLLPSQLRVVSGSLDSLTVSGFSRDMEVPVLPTGDGHVSRSSQGCRFALGVPSLLSPCDTF